MLVVILTSPRSEVSACGCGCHAAAVCCKSARRIRSSSPKALAMRVAQGTTPVFRAKVPKRPPVKRRSTSRRVGVNLLILFQTILACVVVAVADVLYLVSLCRFVYCAHDL